VSGKQALALRVGAADYVRDKRRSSALELITKSNQVS
jgi:hypothetical protein